MKSRVLTLFVLLVTSLFVSGCDDFKKAKDASHRLVSYCDVGLQIVSELRASNVLEEAQAADLTRAIIKVRASTQLFLDRASGYEKFDAKSKEDLGKLFVDVTTGIAELQRVGVLHFKNPETARRFNQVMTGLSIASRLIETRLK